MEGLMLLGVKLEGRFDASDVWYAGSRQHIVPSAVRSS